MKIKLKQIREGKKISPNKSYLIADRLEASLGKLERDGSEILLVPFHYQVVMTTAALMDAEGRLSAAVAVERAIAMLKADESEIRDGNLRLAVTLRKVIADVLSARPELSPAVTMEAYLRVEELIELLINLLKYVPPTIYPLPNAEDSSADTLEVPVETPFQQDARQEGDECRMAREEEQCIGTSDNMEAARPGSVGNEADEADPHDTGEIYSGGDKKVRKLQELKDDSPVSDEAAPIPSEINDWATTVVAGSAQAPPFAPVIRAADQISEYGQTTGLTLRGAVTPNEQEETLHSVREFVHSIEERGVIEYVLSTQPGDFLFASCCLHSILPGIGKFAMMVANEWADFVEESQVEIRSLSMLPEEILESFENLEFELEEGKDSIKSALNLVANPAS